MTSSPVHPALAAAVAYPIAAWIFTGCIYFGMLFSGGSPDISFGLIVLIAPIAIPVVGFHLLASWAGTVQTGSELQWWMLGTAFTWFVVYKVLRRRMVRRAAS